MINNIKVFSKNKNKEEDFEVKKIVETDAGGNQAEVIVVTNGEQTHRISPAATDEDIQKIVADINNRKEGK
jgi:hypothetical protein